MDEIFQLAARLNALSLFRPLLREPVLASLMAFLNSLCSKSHDEPRIVCEYCAFVAALYEEGGDLGEHLWCLVLHSENPVLRFRATERQEPPEMTRCLEEELRLFTRLSALKPKQLAKAAGKQAFLPMFANTAQDFESEYMGRLLHISRLGYGIFAEYHMFTANKDGQLLAVKNPDMQSLSGLTGYERERAQVLQNTEALLNGLPANNILLYGDAGTGKSSTVKAIANEYACDGLRMVEIRKNQLYQIPELMDVLAQNPLKFIIFIDDLSFSSGDGDFTALKAILEGNISARPANIVVYATSNRRHMVKERFSERVGEDVHVNDTIEEETSLSARFGLTVTFLKPNKELYADIVLNLAQEYGVKTPKEQLVKKAERHALRSGGRSPRTARQFIQIIKAEEALY